MGPAPTSGKATASLILGIVSLVMCGLLAGIPAMILGRMAKKEIQASQGRIGGDGLATAGFIMGLISTIITGLAFLLVLLVFIFGGAVESLFEESCGSVTTGDSISVEC